MNYEYFSMMVTKIQSFWRMKLKTKEFLDRKKSFNDHSKGVVLAKKIMKIQNSYYLISLIFYKSTKNECYYVNARYK